MKKKFTLLLFIFFLCGCFKGETANVEQHSQTSEVTQKLDNRVAELDKVKTAIVPFFKLMGKPLDTDWLATNKEAGQTFDEYVKSKPILPIAERQTIYIQPLGNFTDTERKILVLTAAYMRAFYGLPVKMNPERKLENLPPEMTRTNPSTRQTQIKAAYFLENLLPKILPNDAAALICFTNADIYSEDDWSFVFGQASLQNRVGVWSLYRLGKNGKNNADYETFLERTLKIAMHETGHMFSMHHCTKYECLMSGTNNLAETDRRPLDFCPECMAKIAWAMNYKVAERYQNLAKFWAAQGQVKLSREFAAKEKAVSQF